MMNLSSINFAEVMKTIVARELMGRESRPY